MHKCIIYIYINFRFRYTHMKEHTTMTQETNFTIHSVIMSKSVFGCQMRRVVDHKISFSTKFCALVTLIVSDISREEGKNRSLNSRVKMILDKKQQVILHYQPLF